MKTALITGGSRGIGAATARRFAAGGCKVVINYHRSQAQAEALAAELGRKIAIQVKNQEKDRGTITVEFYSKEELADIANRLAGTER